MEPFTESVAMEETRNYGGILQAPGTQQQASQQTRQSQVLQQTTEQSGAYNTQGTREIPEPVLGDIPMDITTNYGGFLDTTTKNQRIDPTQHTESHLSSEEKASSVRIISDPDTEGMDIQMTREYGGILDSDSKVFPAAKTEESNVGSIVKNTTQEMQATSKISLGSQVDTRGSGNMSLTTVPGNNSDNTEVDGRMGSSGVQLNPLQLGYVSQGISAISPVSTAELTQTKTQFAISPAPEVDGRIAPLMYMLEESTVTTLEQANELLLRITHKLLPKLETLAGKARASVGSGDGKDIVNALKIERELAETLATELEEARKEEARLRDDLVIGGDDNKRRTSIDEKLLESPISYEDGNRTENIARLFEQRSPSPQRTPISQLIDKGSGPQVSVITARGLQTAPGTTEQILGEQVLQDTFKEHFKEAQQMLLGLSPDNFPVFGFECADGEAKYRVPFPIILLTAIPPKKQGNSQNISQGSQNTQVSSYPSVGKEYGTSQMSQNTSQNFEIVVATPTVLGPFSDCLLDAYTKEELPKNSFSSPFLPIKLTTTNLLNEFESMLVMHTQGSQEENETPLSQQLKIRYINNVSFETVVNTVLETTRFIAPVADALSAMLSLKQVYPCDIGVWHKDVSIRRYTREVTTPNILVPDALNALALRVIASGKIDGVAKRVEVTISNLTGFHSSTTPTVTVSRNKYDIYRTAISDSKKSNSSNTEGKPAGSVSYQGTLDMNIVVSGFRTDGRGTIEEAVQEQLSERLMGTVGGNHISTLGTWLFVEIPM